MNVARFPRDGRALIGKTIGDTAEVTAPGGGKAYEITGVKFK